MKATAEMSKVENLKDQLKKKDEELSKARILLRDQQKELIYAHHGSFAVCVDLKWGPTVVTIVTKIPDNVTFAKIYLPRAFISSESELLKHLEGHLSENYSVEYLG